MLEGIFGNKTAEKVLFHIYHYGESHPSGVAMDFHLSITPVLNQLYRFESIGVLVSKQIGRSRIFFFNKKNPYTKHIIEIIKIAYVSIPLQERESIFSKRRRPRKKGKVVHGRT